LNLDLDWIYVHARPMTQKCTHKCTHDQWHGQNNIESTFTHDASLRSAHTSAHATHDSRKSTLNLDSIYVQSPFWHIHFDVTNSMWFRIDLKCVAFVAVSCIVLQCVAVCCSVLQCVDPQWFERLNLDWALKLNWDLNKSKFNFKSLKLNFKWSRFLLHPMQLQIITFWQCIITFWSHFDHIWIPFDHIFITFWSHFDHILRGPDWTSNDLDWIYVHTRPMTQKCTHKCTHDPWLVQIHIKSRFNLCWIYFLAHCNTLQHTATHCNTLQHTATHCNTLQRTCTRL